MARGSSVGGEWVGGCFSLPAYVLEDGPERPDAVVWIEATSGLVVGLHLDRPGLGPDDVARCLVRAIEMPIARVLPPAAVRVGDAATADAVRVRLKEAIPVRVGPTPELDEAMASLGDSLAHGAGEGGQERGYLEGGLVEPATVAWMFRAAATLWRVAPWKFATDDQLISVDVPSWGLRGACLSIIGALGQDFGFVLFESVAAYDRFIASAEGTPPDVSGMLLSFGYERRRRLTARMRSEIAEHGWPVAGARAHPIVICLDRDHVARPATQRDVSLAAACADAVAAFAVRHRETFEGEATLPVRAEVRVPTDVPSLAVRLAFPHPASLANVPAPECAGLPAKVGRNDPCPCGSGRKYKRCHLEDVQAPPVGPAATTAKLIALDQRLAGDLQSFANARFGAAVRAVVAAWEEGRDGVPREQQLLVPWITFHRRFDGQPLVAHFLHARGARLSDSERRWLEAQRDTPLSVWQAMEIVPGSHLVMDDLLTGERRTIYDRAASGSARIRDVVLARVVDHEGVSVLCGLHPRALPPSAADGVVRHVRRVLRTRARRMPRARLQDEAVALTVAAEWERAVGADEARFQNLRVTNTDGEPLLQTIDHFEFEPAVRAAVEERLSALADAENEVDRGGRRVFYLHRDGPRRAGAPRRVLVAQIEVGEGTLGIETNSVARAEAARRAVEGACGDLVGHRVREHADPRAALRRGERPRKGAEPLDVPEAAALVLAFKREHYAAWLDEEIPALGNLTPRAAASRPASRRRLELLLQDMERSEAGMPEGQRFDFGWLRSELSLGARRGGSDVVPATSGKRIS